jgi:TonB-dependent receptor
MTKSAKFKLTPVSAAVTSALLAGATQSTALAQEEIEEIVIVGIRGSLQNSMNVKRNATGVVDAITAEDIGKFPDTNLAESLQRITGVSIDRQNGEGQGVTVRGFGPGYNLVTLNGRTIPTADVSAIGNVSSFPGTQGRNFDFSNIASEGVSALEVFKTGQAILPSGGIGATINIQTFKPLNSPGLVGTFGAKAHADTSVSRFDDVTPEITGLFSWTNDDETLGVGAFGSFSQRDSGAASGYVNDYIMYRGPGLASNFQRGDGSTQITNVPGDDQLYGVPQDSRYDFSDISRERINGQLILQFRPMDNLTLTADYYLVENTLEEFRYEQNNWYATPVDEIVFSGEGPVWTPTYMYEFNGGTKDLGLEQTRRGSKDSLDSFGFNAVWDLNETSTLTFDAHSSNSKSEPDNPRGDTATFVSIAAPVVLEHSTDYSAELPIQYYTFDDSIRGNNNGVLDVGDLASQVARSSRYWQDMDVNEFDLRYTMDHGESRVDVGVNYRDTEVFTRNYDTYQDLGSWGMTNAQDIELYAPGLVETFCLACEFDDFPVGDAAVGFRADAVALFEALSPVYTQLGLQNDPVTNTTNVVDNQYTIEEDIISFYAQFQLQSEFIGLPLVVNGGLRYERTDVSSTALQQVPEAVVWLADNDFQIRYGSGLENVAEEADYNHLLPNIDFRLDITDEIVARASYSQTIGRAPYSNLDAATTVGSPNRPTVLGGLNSGSSQNPSLLPLESENFDLSVEWYYGDASYVSVGFYDKTVVNFLGNGIDTRPLFGLLDPTSGEPGTRSGDALDIINDLGIDQSEANLFTLVALIDANGGNVGAAQAEFESNLVNGVLPNAYVDQILGQYDVVGDAADPQMEFRVTQPVNDKEGNINGWELSVQHFFGDTGFGIAANYTIVDGDVEANIAKDPNDQEFALVGLSDTANLTLIYENYGFSARIAYNWRDEFLTETNSGAGNGALFTEEFGQIDATVSYDVTDNLQLSFEGINLNGENSRQFYRIPLMFRYGYELEPRYSFGARYRF